jgi:alpha-L-fucosidase
MTRGVGNSFGYNRNEHDKDYAPFDVLAAEFIDAVAKNGNLLLNVGPRGEDMQIPEEQASRLTAFGRWLTLNGEAIYGTRPWTRAEARTTGGDPVRFTQKGSTLSLIVLGRPSGSRLVVKDLRVDGDASLLSDRSAVRLTSEGADTILTFSRPVAGAFAPVVTVRLAGVR